MSRVVTDNHPLQRVELRGSLSSLATFLGTMIFCVFLSLAIAALLIIGPRMDTQAYSKTANLVLLSAATFFFLVTLLALWAAKNYFGLIRYKDPFYIFDDTGVTDTMKSKTITWKHVGKVDYAPLLPSLFLTMTSIFMPIMFLFFWDKICKTNMSYIHHKDGNKSNHIKIKWSQVGRAKQLQPIHDFIASHIPADAMEVQH